MTPNPQTRRPTLIPVGFGEEDDAQPSLHGAPTMIEGYEPPVAPPAAVPRATPALPKRSTRSSSGFLGFGFAADVVFGVVLSVVFAAGMGIGASMAMP